MPTPVVIDLSHHNTIPQSLLDTAAAGIVGVIHKATEGTGFVDSKVKARNSLAREAGMLWGVYHFLRPGGSMLQQVNHFLSNSPQDQNTLFVADHEDAGVSLDDLAEFLSILEDKTGVLPVIYSGHVLKDQLGGNVDARFTKYRLWLCHYTTGTPVLPPGFQNYWLWQYTDKGSIPGVNSPVDLNAAGVPLNELIAGWAGGEAPPQPEPEPLEPLLVTMSISSDRPVNIHINANAPVSIITGDT
jgi:lysozyme